MSTESDDEKEEKPLVLVIGATGKQGGSVAKHLIRSGKFRVRALVRNPKVEAADELFLLGVELVQGDLNNPSHCTAAVKDVEYAFINTCFDMMTEDPEVEKLRGLNIVINLAQQNAMQPLKHVIYTSIADIPGNVEAISKSIIRNTIISENLPLTTIYPSFYLENFITVWPATRHIITRQLQWWMLPVSPDTELSMPSVAIEDLGGIVCGIFTSDKRESYIGQSIYAISEIKSLQKLLRKFGRFIGESIRFRPFTRRQFDWLPFPATVQSALLSYANMPAIVAENKELFDEHQSMMERSVAECRELYPQMQTVAEWSKAHKEELRNGGPMGSSMSWIRRYAEIMEFLSRPSVMLTVLATIGGVIAWRYKVYQEQL